MKEEGRKKRKRSRKKEGRSRKGGGEGRGEGGGRREVMKRESKKKRLKNKTTKTLALYFKKDSKHHLPVKLSQSFRWRTVVSGQNSFQKKMRKDCTSHSRLWTSPNNGSFGGFFFPS